MNIHGLNNTEENKASTIEKTYVTAVLNVINMNINICIKHCFASSETVQQHIEGRLAAYKPIAIVNTNYQGFKSNMITGCIPSIYTANSIVLIDGFSRLLHQKKFDYKVLQYSKPIFFHYNCVNR